MTSAAGHYDQNLLASAPEVTGERRREGYTTEILNPNPGKATPPLTAQSDVEAGLVTKEYDQRAPARPLPFWRTRKGMIIILVAGIVILGAIIGGAVGGTAGKKDTKGAVPDTGEPAVGGGTGGLPGVGGGGSATPTDSATAPSGSPTASPADPGPDVGGGPKPTSSATTGPIPNVAPSDGDGGKGGDQGGGEQTSGTLFGGLISDAELEDVVAHI